MTQTSQTQPAVQQAPNELLKVFISLFAFLFLATGIILPIVIISEIPPYALDSVIFPIIYFGFSLLVLSVVCFAILSLLKEPNDKTKWVEGVLNAFSTIMILFGVIYFVISISSDTTETLNRNASGLGTFIVVFVFALNIFWGLLCAGLSAIHKKYSKNEPILIPPQVPQSGQFCNQCGTKLPEVASNFCKQCGTKI